MERANYECIDWPEVQTILNRSLKCLSSGAPKKQTLDSLFMILKTCGDYKIQQSVVKRLLNNSDVFAYKDWFSEIWFAGMASTQKAFLDLFEQDSADTRSFVNAFNNESVPSLVLTFKCNRAEWNGEFLNPHPGKFFWLDVNFGSKCFTLHTETGNGLSTLTEDLVTINTCDLRTNIKVWICPFKYHWIRFNFEEDKLIVYTEYLTPLQLDSLDKFLKGVSSVCLAYV